VRSKPAFANTLFQPDHTGLFQVVYGTASLILAITYTARGKGITDRTDPPGLKIFATLLHTPAIPIIAVLFILGMGLNQGVFVILPLYLVFERGIDPETTNIMLAVSRVVAFGIGILAETGRFNIGFAVLGGVTFLCLPLIRMLKKQS
jgi:hypothetical protein